MAAGKRAIDVLLILCFFVFAVIALTIDLTQALYGNLDQLDNSEQRYWPPPIVIEYYMWWCKDVDPLLAANPLWYQIMAVFSPMLYVPYYIAAIYALMNKREWIRVPTLMWGYGLLLSMIPITAEQLFGQHASKNVGLYFAAYGPYMVVPIVAMLRAWGSPMFDLPAHRPSKKSKHQ